MSDTHEVLDEAQSAYNEDVLQEEHGYYDEDLGVWVFIAIHSTALGPALGGIRFRTGTDYYKTKRDVVHDARNLARGMSYKSVHAETPCGGGKTVAWCKDYDPARDQEIKRFIAESINRLGGRYIGGEDVGINEEDIAYMSQFTPYLSGLPAEFVSPTSGKIGGGDPSPITAVGVLEGMKAALPFAGFHRHSLADRRVLVQGAAGKVGRALVDLLVREGAIVILNDLEKQRERLEKIAEKYPGQQLRIVTTPRPKMPPSWDPLYRQACDIFAPCAMGEILNEESIRLLKAKSCRIVAGSANNQLASPEAGEDLDQKGILYVPDYILNSGGLLNVVNEYFAPNGYSREEVMLQVREIGPRVTNILQQAKRQNKPPEVVTDEIAERELVEAKRRKKEARQQTNSPS